MDDATIIGIATEFRDGILNERSSDMACFMVVAPLARLLEMYGLHVEVVEGDLTPLAIKRADERLDCNHFWLELPDGRVLDPTADQFNESGFDSPPVYLGEPLEIHLCENVTASPVDAGESEAQSN